MPSDPDVRRIIAGLGYLEGYGHHPGVPSYLLIVAIGFVFYGRAPGIVLAVTMGMILCFGAYERAVDYERTEGK
jgi:hypothetical protein